MISLDGYRGILSAASNVSPLLRLALLAHRNTRGEPLRFRERPYLVELYRDLPSLDGADICKGVQTGISELLLVFVLERAGWANKIAAYVLPTYSVRDRFVKRRVNPLLASIPAYRRRTGETSLRGRRETTGNLKLKPFGTGAILFLGSNTPGDFVEFSADVLVVDEFDQCDPINLAKGRDRLRASKSPQFFRVGNPTLPNTGVAKLYDGSDQRKWFSRCHRCGEWQVIGWTSHVVDRDEGGRWVLRDPKGAHPVCGKCGRPFNRAEKVGAWVAESPDRIRRGYKVSRLDSLDEDFRTLFREWLDAQGDSNALSTFHTSVLGEPFEFSGARLTDSILGERSVGTEVDYGGGSDYQNRLVTMGVDVGSVLNVSISVVDERTDPVEVVDGDDDRAVASSEPIRRVVFVGAFRTFAEVSDAIRRYRVDVCVIDSMPETRKAKELRDEFGGRSAQVWLSRFAPTSRVGVHRYGMKIDYRESVVTVDRTQVFDVTFDDIREGRRVFPEDVYSVLGWREQMRAPVRVLDEARSRIVWTEGSAPDHYRLADIYDRIAFDLANSGGSYYAG